MNRTTPVLYTLLMTVIFGSEGYTQNNCSESKLIEIVEKIESENSKAADSMYYKAFFRYFPDSFSAFTNYYGEPDSKLIEQHFKHLQFFDSSLAYQEDSLWVNKLVTLSYESRWDADAVYLLHSILKKRFNKNKSVFTKILKQKKDDLVFDFFFFYLDELHPSYSQLPEELQFLKNGSDNMRLLNLANKAMDKVNLK